MGTQGFFTEGKEGKEARVTQQVKSMRKERNRCAKDAEGRIHSSRVGLFAERFRVEREAGAGKPRVRWGAQQVNAIAAG